MSQVHSNEYGRFFCIIFMFVFKRKKECGIDIIPNTNKDLYELIYVNFLLSKGHTIKT
jgi:hypothetical protein